MELGISGVLKSWGFSVEKIPESNEHKTKTPDFFVKDANHSYLIELKEKEDDFLELKHKSDVLKSGDIFGKSISVKRNNTVSGIIRDAYEQLEPYENSDFRLAWLLATGDNQQAKFNQFVASFYGTTRLFTLDDVYHKPCYFFTDSDFFRYKNVLDAAIVSTTSEVRLLVNPFSPNYQIFKESKLFLHFKDAICDPYQEELNGIAYIVDSNIPRKNTEDVLNYLREKYKSPTLMNIDLNFVSASVLAST